MKTPPYILNHVRDAMRLMGINTNEWYVSVTTVPQHELEDGDPATAARVRHDNVYRNAFIRFRKGLKDTNHTREYAYHEVKHISHSDVDNVVDTILAQLEDDKAEFFLKMYDNAVERFIQREVRAMLNTLVSDEVEKASA